MFFLCVLRRVRLPRFGTTYGAARPFLLCPLLLAPWLVFRGDLLFVYVCCPVRVATCGGFRTLNISLA